MFSVLQENNRITEILQLPRRCLRPLVMAVLMITLISNPGVAADGDTPLVVSPISATPSGEVHNGKLVWVDLITTEPKKAANFYATVFGWQPLYFSDENYI